MQYSVKEARAKLGDLLTLAQKGGEVTIVRRGKGAVRLNPVDTRKGLLPSLKSFRAGIETSVSLGAAVRAARDLERS